MPLSRREFGFAVFGGLMSPYIPQVNASTPKEEVNFFLWNDISSSVTDSDLVLEKYGCRAALTDPYVMGAILGQKDIFVMYGEFGTWGHTVIDWRRLETEQDIHNFADRMVMLSRSVEETQSNISGGKTGIFNALGHSIGQSKRLGRAPARQVIDISGDGMENVSEGSLDIYKVEAETHGMQCNGIVFPDLNINHTTPEDHLKYVRAYYEDRVITGPGGFVEEVASIDDYPMAFERKLERELLLF